MRTIETVEELDALPVGSRFRDMFGDVGEIVEPGVVRYPETADMTIKFASRYLPATLLHDPSTPVEVVSMDLIERVIHDAEAQWHTLDVGAIPAAESLNESRVRYVARAVVQATTAQGPVDTPMPRHTRTDADVHGLATVLSRLAEEAVYCAADESELLARVTEARAWAAGYLSGSKPSPVDTPASGGNVDEVDRLSQVHADALATLDFVADRMDEFAYQELHSALEDGVLLRDEDGQMKYKGRTPGLVVTREAVAAIVTTCRDNDHIVSSLVAWLDSLPGVTVAAEEESRQLGLFLRGECPDGPHRGPEGPNEDLSQCLRCLSPSWSMRPEGEEFGRHLVDCSLPRRHESVCKPGGSGHPDAEVSRG